MNEYLDSRDLEDELNNLLENEERTEEEEEELKEIQKLKDECEGYGWENGICFIPDYLFEDYAEDLFNDSYLENIPENLKYYIDYEKFSRDLEMDYSIISFKGNDYYFREA